MCVSCCVRVCFTKKMKSGLLLLREMGERLSEVDVSSELCEDGCRKVWPVSFVSYNCSSKSAHARTNTHTQHTRRKGKECFYKLASTFLKHSAHTLTYACKNNCAFTPTPTHSHTHTNTTQTQTHAPHILFAWLRAEI